MAKSKKRIALGAERPSPFRLPWLIFSEIFFSFITTPAGPITTPPELGLPLHRVSSCRPSTAPATTAEVHCGPQVKSSSLASSGTASPVTDRTLLHITPQRRQPSGPVVSHLEDFHTTRPAADRKYITTIKSSPDCATTLDVNKYG